MTSAGKTFVRRRGTTPIPNRTVHDERLSYAALGLLAVLLARPEGAPSGYRALMGRGLGEKATQAALRELTNAGYRHQLRAAMGRGKLVTHTIISEEPMDKAEAQEWLESTALRAADGAARSDQRKQGKSPGPIVRRDTRHDPSRLDEAPHNSLERVPRVSSLRSETRDPSARTREAEPAPDEAALAGPPDWFLAERKRINAERRALEATS